MHISSKAAGDKLEELGSFIKWIQWLQQDLKEKEERLKNILLQEQMRERPADLEESEPKWEITLLIQTISHSSKDKFLNYWNRMSKSIQLAAGNRGNQITAKFQLPKNILLEEVSDIGYVCSKKFLISLNIGSLGFLWWYNLNDNDSQVIKDIENNCLLKRKNHPHLEIKYANKILQEEDLDRIGRCFSLLPSAFSGEREWQPFNTYFQALACLAKTDLHLSLIPDACYLFFQSLKSGMRLYGNWRGRKSFTKALEGYLKHILSDEEECSQIIELFNNVQSKKENPYYALTHHKALQMKAICDLYFNEKFRKISLQNFQKEEKNSHL